MHIEQRLGRWSGNQDYCAFKYDSLCDLSSLGGPETGAESGPAQGAPTMRGLPLVPIIWPTCAYPSHEKTVGAMTAARVDLGMYHSGGWQLAKKASGEGCDGSYAIFLASSVAHHFPVPPSAQYLRRGTRRPCRAVIAWVYVCPCGERH